MKRIFTLAAALILSTSSLPTLAAPAPSSTYTVITTFDGNNDGAYPFSNVIVVGGTLYGTTINGGGGSSKCTNGCGTIFSVDSTSRVKKVAYAFEGGSDSAMPFGNLVSAGGVLYGTSNYGGSSNCYDGCGTIFSFDPTTGAEKIVYAFQGLSDGRYPAPGLIKVGGSLYGFNANGYGQVFALNISSGSVKAVYSFQGGNDGAMPSANMINVGGILFGTTVSGGGSSNCSGGCGTVFSLSPKAGVEKVVYAFNGGDDSASPSGSLINVNGILYGTTSNGGVNGYGTVFSINPANSAESVVYAFKGGVDGSAPSGSLGSVGYTLYGATIYGGSSNFGTVFTVNLRNNVEQVVHTFSGGTNGFDGAEPVAGLMKAGKILYGTTSQGGSGYGSVFSYIP